MTTPVPSGIAKEVTLQGAVDQLTEAVDRLGGLLTNTQLRATPVPVDLMGAAVSGTFTPVPSVLSTENVPPAPLAANAVFTGEWEDVLQYAAIQVSLTTDAPSITNGAVVEFSDDGVNVVRNSVTTIPANFGAYFHLPKGGNYVRFRYTNGPVAQTSLELSIMFSYTTPAEVVQPLGSTITDANSATVVRAGLATRMMSGPSAGAYVPVGNDGTGRMLVDTELSAGGPLGTEATLAAVLASTTPSLVKRMSVNDPAPGYAMWQDVTASNPLYIYKAEAPLDSNPASDGVWRGIRVTLDANGIPLGPVAVASNFAWDNRAAASWDS